MFYRAVYYYTIFLNFLATLNRIMGLLGKNFKVRLNHRIPNSTPLENYRNDDDTDVEFWDYLPGQARVKVGSGWRFNQLYN